MNGVFTQNYSNDDQVEAMALQPDGKLVIVGRTNDQSVLQDLILMRINAENAVGIAENDENNKLDVYPNPTSNRLNINNVNDATKAELYNTLGELIDVIDIDRNSDSVDLSTYENGIYNLRVGNSNAQVVKTE